MAAASTTKRGRTWEKEETIILLEIWGETNIQEQLKQCNRKKPIWVQISNHLKASGYEDRQHDACKTRIHTLVSYYRRYKDECAKTGNATPGKKAPFFDELDKILSDKPSTRPAVLINSLQSSVDVCEERELEERTREEDEDELDELSFGDENAQLEANNSDGVAVEEEKYKPKKKRRRTSNGDVLAKIDDTMTEFMQFHRDADKNFLEAEKERERREEEREEKRREEDQEFLLKLASILKK